MTPQQQRAHERLLLRLPVRHVRHLFDDGEINEANHARPLMIDGRYYQSMNIAKRTLRCGINRLTQLFTERRAEWVK